MIKRTLFWIFFTISVAIIAGVVWIYQIIVTLQTPVVATAESATFEVVQGDTWDGIFQRLEEGEFIDRTQGLDFYVRFRELSPKQGVYKISSETTISSLIGTIDRGIRNRPEITVTIPEGSDIQEIAEIISPGLDFTEEEFVTAASDFDITQYEFIQGENLEGYLFPDTYRFFETATPQDVIAKMLVTFQQKALPFLQATDDLSAYEVLILASIVEKEVFSFEDRQNVAQVFLNRLEIDMMLQSDATVNYITRSGRAQATFADLEVESPYNTYQVTGLPPTPITNPGVAAIQSVLDPTPNDFLFFLTTKDSPPVTIFSETFEEHSAAKREFLDE